MSIGQQTVLNQGYSRSYKVTWASPISVEKGWYAELCLHPASSQKTPMDKSSAQVTQILSAWIFKWLWSFEDVENSPRKD